MPLTRNRAQVFQMLWIKLLPYEGAVTHLDSVYLGDSRGSVRVIGSWSGFSLRCMLSVCQVVSIVWAQGMQRGGGHSLCLQRAALWSDRVTPALGARLRPAGVEESLQGDSLEVESGTSPAVRWGLFLGKKKW